MNGKTVAAILLCLSLLATAAQADPILSVIPVGDNGSGNRDWLVQVTPDLFGAGSFPGVMAVELAFAIDDTDLLGVEVNTEAWDTELFGVNPFTGEVTEGLWLDLIGDRTFGAFGSIFFRTAAPVELFTIETAGMGTATIRYGSAASGHPTQGAAMYQGESINYYSGSVTVPEPTSGLLALVVLAMLIWRGRR